MEMVPFSLIKMFKGPAPLLWWLDEDRGQCASALFVTPSLSLQTCHTHRRCARRRRSQRTGCTQSPRGPSWHFFFFLHSLRRLKAPQIKPETQALFVLADSLTRRSTWVVSGGSYDTLFIQLQKAEAGDESTRVSEDINLRTPHRRACFAPHIQAVACEIFPLRGF